MSGDPPRVGPDPDLKVKDQTHGSVLFIATCCLHM